MSQDPIVKMYNTLEFYRAKAENVETKFGGGTITMLATDFIDIFKYIRQLQNDALVQMEDKEFEREQKWGLEKKLKLNEVSEKALELGAMAASAAAEERDRAKKALADAEAHAAVLQQIIDWQRWLLDEVEAEDAAKGPTP